MEGRPLYRAMTALGFGALTLAALVFVVADPRSATIGFAAVIAVVSLLAAFLVLKFPWGRYVGLVVALLGQLAMFWLVFGLLAFTSVFDFAASLLGELGLVTAIVSSILAIARRGSDAVFEERHRRRISVVGAVVLVLVVLSGVLTLTAQETVPEAEATGATLVDMRESEFVPERLAAGTGVATKYVVHNSDRIAHTFTIKSAKIDEIITPGSEKLIVFTPSASGTVELTCVFHADMKGVIQVS